MSPRAAWRLERLGYRVYDYTAGKADWLAAGLGTVRGSPTPARAIDAIERDIPTCSPYAPVSSLDAVFDGRVAICVVVTDQRIVLGRIRRDDLEAAAPDATAEQVMAPGPATVRADADLEATRDRLRQRRVGSILVTTPEGELLGLLRGTDAGDR